MAQPDEPQARGYNEAEIAAAEEQFDALMDAGITAAVAAMVAAILAEPIPSMISDATLQPLFTLWNAYTADVLVPELTRIFLGSGQMLIDTAEPVLLALSYELTDIAPLDEPAASWMAQASNRLRNVGNIVWEEIREQLTEGVKAGDGIPELAARVQQAAGFSEVRARLTARTEVAAASNGGSITQARALGLDMDKQWEATADTRTRPTHVIAHHQTVPLGAPFIVGDSLLDFPGDPTGEASEVINCFPGDTLVTPIGSVKRVYRRWYEGDMIRINTASGMQLTGTPNHPVLTRQGWKPFNLIDEGDEVFNADIADWMSSGYPQVDYVPTQFAEMYRAASEAGMTDRVVGGAVDFHGDGADGEVQIVSLDRGLAMPAGASFGNYVLVGGGHAEALVSSLDDLRGSVGVDVRADAGDVVMTAPSSIGIDGKPTPIVYRGTSHTDEHRLASPPDGHLSLYEAAPNDTAGNTEPGGDLLFGELRGVHGHDGIRIDGGTPLKSLSLFPGSIDASLSEDGPNEHRAEASLAGDAFQALPFAVQADKVVNVEIGTFSGHVYNLETDTGMYIANGITVSNCRCSVTYVNIRRRGELPTVAAGFVEGQHPRDREGQFAEKPGLGAKVDVLKLDGRIDLGPGQQLVASREAPTSDSSENAVLLAMTRTPSGPEMRLGIVGDEDESRWRAGNLGGTVRLDEAALGRIDTVLADIDRDGKAFQTEFQRGWDKHDDLVARRKASDDDDEIDRLTEQIDAIEALDSEKVLAEGTIPGTAWGDIAYQAAGIDDGDGGWELTIAIRPPDAPPSWNLFEDAVSETKDARFSPKDVRALRKHIAAMLEKAMSEQPETAAAATHTGAMIALVPIDADIERLALTDGEPAEELHLTVMYLGDAADIDPDGQAAVHAMCAELAGVTPPIAGDGFALNVFNPHTDERDTAIVMGVGGDGLAELHAAVSGGVKFRTPKQHAPYVPHVTLAYSDDLSMLPDLVGRLGPVTLDRLRVAFGDEVTDYPLTGSVDGSTFDVESWFAVSKGKIRFGQPGGFRRCVRELRDEPGVTDPEGLCATLHHRATGKWPSEKAGMTVAATSEPVAVDAAEMYAEQLAYEDMMAEAVPGAMFHTLMHTEGLSTGRRVQMPGSLTWRTPPIPLNWQIESGMHGGQKKVIEVGLVTDVARHGTEIHGWGMLDLDDPRALEYARKLAAGWIRGVSVGMDEQPMEVEYLYSPNDPDKVVQEVYLGGNIMEVTSSGGVAQESAYVEPLPPLLEALAARGIEIAPAADDCGCPDVQAPVS